MVASVVIGIIVFIIALVIYLEYRNEKKYQEERREQRERKQKKLTPKVTKRPSRSTATPTHPSPETSAPVTKPQPAPTEESPKTTRPIEKPSPVKEPEKPKEVKLSAKKTTKISETRPPRQETAAESKRPKNQKPATELPKGEYPDFNYERLIEMGLSEEEALEFIQELIPQIAEQIPLIDDAMKIPDFHQMERLTHSIKGSSTTIGTGGVSDLLVEYNTYLKTGTELPVAEAYQEHLKRYFEKLKKQFPKKD
jgi:HPt (histidine-containing phosphotransfer) domain-containing protein